MSAIWDGAKEGRGGVAVKGLIHFTVFCVFKASQRESPFFRPATCKYFQAIGKKPIVKVLGSAKGDTKVQREVYL